MRHVVGKIKEERPILFPRNKIYCLFCIGNCCRVFIRNFGLWSIVVNIDKRCHVYRTECSKEFIESLATRQEIIVVAKMPLTEDGS